MGNCWNAQLSLVEGRNASSSEVAADGSDEVVKKIAVTPPGTPEDQLATGKEIVEEKKVVIEGEEGESSVASVLPTKRKQQIVSFIAENDESDQDKQASIRRKGTPHHGSQLQDSSDSQLETRDVDDLPCHIDDDIQKESIANETDDATNSDKAVNAVKSENIDSAASSPAKTDAVIEKQKLFKVPLSNAYADAANDSSSSSTSISSKAKRFFGLNNLKAKYSKKSDAINAIQQESTDSGTAKMNEVEESNDKENK